MAEFTEISMPQRSTYSRLGVIIEISISLSMLLLLSLTYWALHAQIGWGDAQLPELADRIGYGLKVQIFSVLPMVVSLNHVMLTRFLVPGAHNPLAGNEDRVALPNRILVNTVEQLVLSFFNLTILSALLPEDCMYIVPFLVFCFVFGRLTFLVGYMIHPKHRMFGLMFTFVPTMVVFGFNLIAVCCGM